MKRTPSRGSIREVLQEKLRRRPRNRRMLEDAIRIDDRSSSHPRGDQNRRHANPESIEHERFPGARRVGLRHEPTGAVVHGNHPEQWDHVFLQGRRDQSRGQGSIFRAIEWRDTDPGARRSDRGDWRAR